MCRANDACKLAKEAKQEIDRAGMIVDAAGVIADETLRRMMAQENCTTLGSRLRIYNYMVRIMNEAKPAMDADFATVLKSCPMAPIAENAARAQNTNPTPENMHLWIPIFPRQHPESLHPATETLRASDTTVPGETLPTAGGPPAEVAAVTADVDVRLSLNPLESLGPSDGRNRQPTYVYNPPNSVPPVSARPQTPVITSTPRDGHPRQNYAYNPLNSGAPALQRPSTPRGVTTRETHAYDPPNSVAPALARPQTPVRRSAPRDGYPRQRLLPPSSSNLRFPAPVEHVDVSELD